MSDGRDDSTKWLDGTSFFRVHCASFHNHSPLLIFFLCCIVLFQSCCSHAQVFGKTLLHEFSIFYSHTEWNLLSSGTNTLLWWRACFKKLNYKQTNSTLPVEVLPTIVRVSDFKKWKICAVGITLVGKTIILHSIGVENPIKQQWV